MFNKIFYFIKRNISRGKCTLKQEKGFSLVEVIIAIVVISIVTLVLVSGTMTAVNVLKINKAKTLCSAVASEKLELIKCMDYEEDIETEDINPDWPPPLDDPDNPEYDELFEDGYIIVYDITWVDGEDSYKQVKIEVSKEPMGKPISVISHIYPTGETEGESAEYPSPENLEIVDDSGSGLGRDIKLAWEAPAETGIHHYNIYRDDEATPFAGPSSTSYTDSYVGDNNVHSYYVTAVYSDGGVSGKSNEVTTEYLRITDYKLGGPNRTVYLAWGEAPDTGLEFIEFVVYKIDMDDVEISSVPVGFDTSYEDKIGSDNFTYYVIAIYYDEGDEVYIEGYTSNEVDTTE